MNILAARDEVYSLDPSQIPEWVQSYSIAWYISFAVLTAIVWDACAFFFNISANWRLTSLTDSDDAGP